MGECVINVEHNGSNFSKVFPNVYDLNLKPMDMIQVNGINIEIRSTKVEIIEIDGVDTFTRSYNGTSSGVPQ